MPDSLIPPSQLVIGNTYDLTMAVPAYHGTVMENMRLVSIMDYESALESSPVDATHASVKALVDNTVDMPVLANTSTFLKFRSTTGVTQQAVYLSVDWITSAVLVSTIQRTLVLQIASTEAENTLKNILAHLSPGVTVLQYRPN